MISTRSQFRSKPSIGSEIYIEVSSKCNLSCLHCCRSFISTCDEINLEEISRFHQILRGFGISSIVITGGEPSLHSQFIELVQTLSNDNRVTITTNGYSISPQVIEQLLRDIPLLFVQISLDGFSRESIDSMRGHGAYARILPLIESLIADGYSDRIGISMTITKINYNDVSRIIQFARSNGIASLHFPQLLPIGNALQNWDILALPLNKQLVIERELMRYFNEDLGNASISINRINRIGQFLLQGKSADCLLNPTLKISADGTIFPCPVTSNMKYAIGNICSISSVEDFLNKLSIRLQSFREEAMASMHIIDDLPFCVGLRTCENCNLIDTIDKAISYYGLRIMNHHIADAISELQASSRGLSNVQE